MSSSANSVGSWEEDQASGAEPEAVSRNGSSGLALTIATQRSPMNTDRMYMGMGYPARFGRISAPCFGLTYMLGELYARREVSAKMDSSGEQVGGTVYQAHKVIAHGFSGGQRAGE
jgi:hypothetical protein